MKGLLLSAFVLVGYVISVAVAARLVRFERKMTLYMAVFAIWIPLYFIAYLATPPNVWILPESWSRVPWELDLAYGFVVFALNVNNSMDVFFGLNEGFSTCLLLEIHRGGPRGLTTDELGATFRSPDGTDKIYAWRLPRLEASGYLVIDPTTGTCRLTGKGLWLARIAWWGKRILNLGPGG